MIVSLYIFQNCIKGFLIIMVCISYTQVVHMIMVILVREKPPKDMEGWKPCYTIFLTSLKTSSQLGI